MIPSMTYNGDQAHFRSCMRTGRNIFIGGLILALAFVGYSHDAKLDGISESILLIFFGGLISAVIGFGEEYWTYKSTRNWGLHGSAIFKALGVPRPDDFSLYGHLDLSQTSVPFGYRFEKALEAHAKRYPELVASKT